MPTGGEPPGDEFGRGRAEPRQGDWLSGRFPTSDPTTRCSARSTTTPTRSSSSSATRRAENPAPRGDADICCAACRSRSVRARALSDQRGLGQQPGAHPVAQDPAGHLRCGRRGRRATAVIVHGGHADDNDMEAGFERWEGAQRPGDRRPGLPGEHRGRRPRKWPGTSTPSPGCGTASATWVSGSAWTPATPGRPARN